MNQPLRKSLHSPHLLYSSVFFLLLVANSSLWASIWQVGNAASKDGMLTNLQQIYESNGKELKILYPSDWTKFENTDNVSLISPLENKSDNFQEKLIFSTQSTGNIKPANMMSLKIIGYRQNLNGFTLLDFKKDILDGNPAFKIIYSYRQGDLRLTNLEVYTNIGTKTYSFYFIVAADKYKIYFPLFHEILSKIKILELTTPQVGSSPRPAELKITDDPTSMVANSITERLYVTNIRFHTVSVIDSLTDRVLKEIKVGRYPASIDIDKGLNNIFVANSRSNSISVIDGSTDEVVSEINTGNEPGSLIVDDTEKGLDSLVFVANSHSDTISLIDGDKIELMKEKIITQDIPSGIALNRVTNRLYVTFKDLNSVSVIDYFLSENGSFHYNNITAIKVGYYPTGINVNQDTNKIYVANSHSNTISVIDGSSNTVEKVVPVGLEPANVEIDPDSNKIYVTNYQNNTVSVINGSSDNIIVNLPVGRYPDAIYLNPINHIIYVVNFGSNTISQIQNTSLLTGVTYSIHPDNSGILDCGGNKIMGNDYIRYKVGSEIECFAEPNSDFEFKSWSTDLDLASASQPETRFKSTQYGNVTANFLAPVVLNLPEGYWDQVRLAVASVVIPAVIGWLIPSIASFLNGVKQRRSMRKSMQEIVKLYKMQESPDNESYSIRLLQLQNEIIKKLTSGKISESQYQILDSKITSIKDKK